MASCCQSCGCESCRCSRNFTDPNKPGYALSRTLAGTLAPIADQLRDLYTCLGTRGYSVLLVRTRWSGGTRGEGIEEVIDEQTLLPVPRVKSVQSMERDAQPVGVLESGELRVDQISTRYTEDQLLGRLEGGDRTPRDQSFYWEVRVIGDSQVRRRFFPKSPPELDQMNVQWVVRLVRAQADRGRDGSPR